MLIWKEKISKIRLYLDIHDICEYYWWHINTQGDINLKWILDNKEWIFSGIGVVALSILLAVLKKIVKNENSQEGPMIQKSGKDSRNYQTKGSINIRNERGQSYETDGWRKLY